MKIVVGISGKQYSGKDTLSQIMLDDWLADIGFKRCAMADQLKIAYYGEYFLKLDVPDFSKISCVNYAKAHDPHTRSKLIAMGDAIRAQDADSMARALLATDDQFIIVTDMRFVNEMEYFREHADRFISIRVDSDTTHRSRRGLISNDTDPSETELDDASFDITIPNNGSLNELQAHARLAAFHIVNAIGAFYSEYAHTVLGDA